MKGCLVIVALAILAFTLFGEDTGLVLFLGGALIAFLCCTNFRYGVKAKAVRQ